MIKGLVVDTDRLSLEYYRELYGFLKNREFSFLSEAFVEPFPSPHIYVSPTGDLFFATDRAKEIELLAKFKYKEIERLRRGVTVNEQVLYDKNLPDDLSRNIVETITNLRTKLFEIEELNQLPRSAFLGSFIFTYAEKPTLVELIEFKEDLLSFFKEKGISLNVLSFRWITIKVGEPIEEEYL